MPAAAIAASDTPRFTAFIFAAELPITPAPPIRPPPAFIADAVFSDIRDAAFTPFRRFSHIIALSRRYACRFRHAAACQPTPRR